MRFRHDRKTLVVVESSIPLNAVVIFLQGCDFLLGRGCGLDVVSMPYKGIGCAGGVDEEVKQFCDG